MRYKNTFINHYLCIKVSTNSKSIYKLIANVLDFDNIYQATPKIKIDFYLDEVNSKNRDNDKDFLSRYGSGGNKNPLYSFSRREATVTVDPKTGTVKGSIVSYQESYKERILDFIFTQPLRFILSYYGLFFLHASVVSKGKDCMLITGPQDSGKSTLALLLSRNGFNLLGDDDCFVKLVKNQTLLFPFPTKMGLNDMILKRYPKLHKYILKDWRYGEKHRLSLNYISKSRNAEGLKCRTIIFPKYKADRNVSMKQLSKKEGLGRLFKESLAICNKGRFLKLAINKFKALCSLMGQADSFELTYNDNNLNKITEVIKKDRQF